MGQRPIAFTAIGRFDDDGQADVERAGGRQEIFVEYGD